MIQHFNVSFLPKSYNYSIYYQKNTLTSTVWSDYYEYLLSYDNVFIRSVEFLLNLIRLQTTEKISSTLQTTQEKIGKIFFETTRFLSIASTR
jgi:hypothetical protein